MKMAMKDGKIMLIEVDNTQMAIIKSWNSMKYDRRKSMMIGDCSKELLDKLSKIVRLPPAIEKYRQQLDETQRAVDKMRIEKEPEAGIISRTVQDFKRKMAQYFNVPLRKIKQISRGEYEAYADRDYPHMSTKGGRRR